MSNYLNGGAWRSRFHFEVVSGLSSLRNYFPDFPELFYPSCAENPAVQGGDVERGERSSPKLNSVSAAARCTGG